MKESGSEMETEVEFEEEATREDLMTDAMVVQSEIAAVTDEDVEMAYENRAAMRERLHAEVALNTALDHGVFPEDTPPSVFLPTAEKRGRRTSRSFRHGRRS